MCYKNPVATTQRLLERVINYVNCCSTLYYNLINPQFYQQHKPYLGVQKQLYIHGHCLHCLATHRGIKAKQKDIESKTKGRRIPLVELCGPLVGLNQMERPSME